MAVQAIRSTALDSGCFAKLATHFARSGESRSILAPSLCSPLPQPFLGHRLVSSQARITPLAGVSFKVERQLPGSIPNRRSVPHCSAQSTSATGGKMMVRLGDTLPDMEVNTTKGKFKLHEWVGDGWGAIFSYPAAFTPVCTTELSTVAQYQPEFQKRDVKLLGLSTDSLENQAFFDWLKDVEAYAKTKIEFPIVCDPSRTVSDQLNMLDLDNLNDDGNPQNARAIHVIRPDKKIKLMLIYPGAVGRNFDEVLRAIDALKLNWKYHVATPANWKPGKPIIVPPKISEEEAKKKGVKITGEEEYLPSKKKYLRWGEVEELFKS